MIPSQTLAFDLKKSGEGLRPILMYKYKVQIASKYFPVENIASQVQSTFSGDNGQMLLKQWSVPTAQIKDKKAVTDVGEKLELV